MHRFRLSTGFLALFVGITHAHSQFDEGDWTSIRKTDEMEIFSRLGDSEIKEIRISLRLEGTLQDVIHLLGDVPGYTRWVYKCVESVRLKTISENEFYYYVVTDFPFPFSDRDLIVHSRQRIDREGVYHSHSVVNVDLVAPKESMVRIPVFESFWRISPIGPGLLRIDYKVESSPGGAIPIWLVNFAVSVGPYETMTMFLEQVAAMNAVD